MKIETKKCIVIDGRPFIDVNSAAKSMALLLAARYAEQIRLEEQAKGNYISNWKNPTTGVIDHCLYPVYGISLPTEELVTSVRERRKRAYKKFKARLERLPL